MKETANAAMKGDLKTLGRMMFPLLLFLLCETLTSLFERILLSYHSVQGVHSSLNGVYLAIIFQSPCVAIASMGQVFVGFYQGREELKQIGPCVWQLIWFSLLSIFLTLPLSMITSHFYFKDTALHHAGTEYFNVLAMGNFLFPLSMSLSSFYLGRGKTGQVTVLMLLSYALNILLCRSFVFGLTHVLPPLGIKGAALAKCCSQLFLCGSLFILFLSKKHQTLYNTVQWRFCPSMLWHYMRPGLVRAFGYLSSKVWWTAITYLMIRKGGFYLDVVTVGGTVITFLTFVATAVYRSMLAISSNLLGSKKYEEIGQLSRSLIGYLFLIAVILVMPLLMFPHSVDFFFDTSSKEIFRNTFPHISGSVWFYIVALTLQIGLCSLIVTTRDMKLQFYCYFFTFFTSFCPVYFFIYKGTWNPDKLWLIMSFENLILACIFFLRLQQKRWEKKGSSNLEAPDKPI